MKTVLTIIAAMTLPLSLANAEPYTYAPDNCDMQITFPEEPYKEQKCLSSGTQHTCVDVLTYKQVSPPDASVTFRVICESLNTKNSEHLNQEFSERTLKKLLEDRNYEAYDIGTDEIENIQRSTSLSIGTTNSLPYIYTGQIWIGEKSIFTLEAVMQGGKDEKVESVFAKILKTTMPQKTLPKAP